MVKSARVRVRFSDHNRETKKFLRSVTTSLIATEAFEVVVLMMTSAIYGSLLSTGILGLAMRLTPVVFSPLITAWLDRSPGRRVFFARTVILIRAIAISGFTVMLAFDSLPSLLAYIIIAVVSSLDVAFLSSSRAVVPLLVHAKSKKRLVTDATSRIVVSWNTVQVLVPPVVSFLLSHISAPLVLVISAALLLGAFILLGYPSRAVIEETVYSTDNRDSSFFDRLVAGLSAVIKSTSARAVVIAGATSSATIFAFSLSAPIVMTVAEVPDAVGIALSLMAFGSVFGAKFSGQLTSVSAYRRALVIPVVLQCGVLAGVAVTANFAWFYLVFVFAAFALGYIAGVLAVIRSTILQDRFDATVLGGVFITVTSLSQLLMPVVPAVWSFTLTTFNSFSLAFGALALIQGLGVILLLLDSCGSVLCQFKTKFR